MEDSIERPEALKMSAEEGGGDGSQGGDQEDLESFISDETAATGVSDDAKQTVDSLLENLGEFGPFQRILYFALWFPAASMAVGVYASVYMEYTPEYHCAVHSEEYNPNFSNLTCSTLTNDTCSEWVYDQSVFTSTVVSYFNLVCDASYLKTVSSMVYMTGMLFGSFFFGWFGDTFGRKAAFGATTLCLSVGSVAAAVSPNLAFYVVARFLTASGGMGLFITVFVIAMEFIGPKYRTTCMIAIEIPFALGELYIVGLAYLIRDWQVYQLVIGVPFFLFLLYLIKIPESVRWLLTRGRRADARKLIHDIAAFNNVILPDLNVEQEDEEEEGEGDTKVEKVGVSCILTNSVLRTRFLIIALNWVVTTLGYYGLSLSSAGLGTDAFSSFALSAAMEIPSYIFCIFSLDRVGRKGILCFSQLLAGSTCILAAVLPLPADLAFVKIILSLIGKFGTSAGFAVVFVYTAELFPTPVRNSALGFCSTAGRLAGILSPFVASLAATSPLLPFLIMGCCCCLGGLAALALPETAGQPLYDTVEQAVNNGGGKSKGANYAANIQNSLIQDK